MTMTMFDAPSFFPSSAPTRIKRLVRSLALAAVVATALGVLSLGASSPALAQAEPTIKQIYDMAASGKLPEAQTMVQQVLVAHPKSAKAHFVQAELFARQGNAPRAREALAEADRLEPGLAFVKPEVVRSLRAQLQAQPLVNRSLESGDVSRPSATSALVISQKSTAWVWQGLMFLALGVGAAVLIFKKMTAKQSVTTPGGTYSSPAHNPNGAAGPFAGGLSGPQTFGNGGGGGGVNSPSPYGQNYAQPGQAGYGQQPAGGMMSGMGGRVAGGLATGLAVGAGVMAAQAIGRSFSGNDAAGHADRVSGGTGSSGTVASPGSLTGEAGDPMGGNRDLGNRDMGGQNFGLNDAAGNSWDDAGSADSFSADAGGGGDWDS